MPIVTLSNNTGSSFIGVEDSGLQETTPTTNLSTNGVFETTSWAVGDQHVSLIRFPSLTNIPPGSTITSVTLRLTLLAAVSPALQDISAFRVVRAWSLAGTTWNTTDGTTAWGSPGARQAGVDRASTASAVSAIPGTAAAGQTYDWTGAGLVADVQAWVDGAANNGWVLDRTPLFAYDNRGLVWGSSEAADGSRPVLIVDYTGGSTGWVTTGTGPRSVPLAGAGPLAAGTVGLVQSAFLVNPGLAGQASTTEAADFAAGSALLAVSASGQLQDHADHLFSAASVAGTAAGSISEQADAINAQAPGAVSRSAAVAVQETADAVGSGVSMPINVQANVLDQQEQLQVFGSAWIAAQAIAVEQADGAFASFAARLVSGAAPADGSDSASASASAQSNSQAQIQEAPEFASAAGSTVQLAVAQAQEQADTAAASASLQAPRQAAAVLSESPDSVGSAAVVVAALQGTAGWVEQSLQTASGLQVELLTQAEARELPDATTGSLAGLVQASALAVDRADSVPATSSVALQASALIREGADLGSSDIRRLLLAAGTVIEAGDVVVLVTTTSIQFAPFGRRTQTKLQTAERPGDSYTARPVSPSADRPAASPSRRPPASQRTRR